MQNLNISNKEIDIAYFEAEYELIKKGIEFVYSLIEEKK